MGKKALLKRIKHLEDQLVSSGLGYRQQFSDEPGDEEIVVYNITEKFNILHEKLALLAKSSGKVFRWRHSPATNLELVQEEKKKK